QDVWGRYPNRKVGHPDDVRLYAALAGAPEGRQGKARREVDVAHAGVEVGRDQALRDVLEALDDLGVRRLSVRTAKDIVRQMLPGASEGLGAATADGGSYAGIPATATRQQLRTVDYLTLHREDYEAALQRAREEA